MPSESREIKVRARNLGKCYQIYDRPSDRLKQSLFRGRRNYFREFWALRGVDLEAGRGETIGIIGRNGSGKSTLLQILAGTLSPTEGELSVKGRVAALLELGAGFNPDFTGRENVYMNAALLGLSRRETDARFSDIAAFADIGDFIEQPVKIYSSGMFVRLAFAVAVSVEPEIMLIDEALSVGDVQFQKKCITRMEEHQKKGVTIFFVSHAIEQVKRFCAKAVWIEGGTVRQIGPSDLIADRYYDFLHLEREEKAKAAGTAMTPAGSPARIRSLRVSAGIFKTFDRLEAVLEYEILEDHIDSFLVGIAIYDRERNYVFGANTYLDKVEVPGGRGDHRVRYVVPSLPLLPGTYFVDTGLFTNKGIVTLDYRIGVASFEVENDYQSEGMVHLDHEWSTDG